MTAAKMATRHVNEGDSTVSDGAGMVNKAMPVYGGIGRYVGLAYPITNGKWCATVNVGDFQYEYICESREDAVNRVKSMAS
jgi:hypothetical protein